MLRLTTGPSHISVAAIDGGSPEEDDAAVDMRIPQRLRRERFTRQLPADSLLGH
jgi:hypothetical protein